MSFQSESPRHFYVGYQANAPRGLAAWLRVRVAAAVVALLTLGFGLVSTQQPFSDGRFEFGVVRSFEGVVELEPVPSLVVARPGQNRDAASRYLLVAFGKHGAGPSVEAVAGHRVRLDGTLVHRDGQTMIELAADSVEDLGVPPELGVGGGKPVALGPRTLRGEIVDSKCFLGVMKPGHLKPHRACAVRCISGGIPPVFLVRDSEGSATYYLLTDADGGAVNERVLDRVAEPLEIYGDVLRFDNLLVLRSDPGTYRRVSH